MGEKRNHDLCASGELSLDLELPNAKRTKFFPSLVTSDDAGDHGSSGEETEDEGCVSEPPCGHDSDEGDDYAPITIRRGRGRPRKAAAATATALAGGGDGGEALDPRMIMRLLHKEDNKAAVLKRTGFSNNYVMKLQRKVLHASKALQLPAPEAVHVAGRTLHVLFQEDGTPLFIKKEICELLQMKGTTFSYWKKKVGVEEIDTASDFRLMDRCRGIFGGRSTYTLYAARSCLRILVFMRENSRQRAPFQHLEELVAAVEGVIRGAPRRAPEPSEPSEPLELSSQSTEDAEDPADRQESSPPPRPPPNPSTSPLLGPMLSPFLPGMHGSTVHNWQKSPLISARAPKFEMPSFFSLDGKKKF